MEKSPTPNPLEVADRLQSYFDHFVSVRGCHGFYRTLGPGITLANFIFGFMDFAEQSKNSETKENANNLLKIYSIYYKRLTGFAFDHTAPTAAGDFLNFLESIEHFDNDLGESPLCTCSRCQILT